MEVFEAPDSHAVSSVASTVIAGLLVEGSLQKSSVVEVLLKPNILVKLRPDRYALISDRSFEESETILIKNCSVLKKIEQRNHQQGKTTLSPY